MGGPVGSQAMSLRVAARSTLQDSRRAITGWSATRWAVAVLAAVAAAFVMGVVPTSLYTRMTPVTWWDYPFWIAASVLAGLIAATYMRGGDASPTGRPQTARTAGGTVLSVFAIGCPICNKLVIALLGVSGALTWFAPVQPLIGLLSVGLLAAGLAVRLRGMVACPVEVTGGPAAATV